MVTTDVAMKADAPAAPRTTTAAASIWGRVRRFLIVWMFELMVSPDDSLKRYSLTANWLQKIMKNAAAHFASTEEEDVEVVLRQIKSLLALDRTDADDE